MTADPDLSPPRPGLAVLPVPGIPEVRRGDDLVALLATALRAGGPSPVRDGDVLCVSSKIVSKARGLVVPPSQKARAVAEAAVRLVARRIHGSVVTSVVETVSGPVLAGAGIDASNAPDGLLLLPEDPDAEAAELCRGLRDALGVRVGVILTDTSSRIWRAGVADFALGAAGVEVLEDLRGGTDDAGRPLGVTVRAVGDELAAAADLVKGKTGRTPVAIVRDLSGGDAAPLLADPAGGSARAVVRTGPSDWFRRPALEAVWQAMGLAAEDEPIAAMDPEPDAQRIARAIAVATSDRRDEPEDDRGTADHESCAAPRILAEPGSAEIVVEPGDPSPAACARAGMLVERLRIALGAEAIAQPIRDAAVRLRLPSTPDVDPDRDVPAGGAR